MITKTMPNGIREQVNSTISYSKTSQVNDHQSQTAANRKEISKTPAEIVYNAIFKLEASPEFLAKAGEACGMLLFKACK
jgi:hypothetical protein